MKKIATLLVFVLGSLVLLCGQQSSQGPDNSQAKEMVGTICNADNLTQAGGQSTCDESKGGKSADWVFISDEGKVTKIANPEALKGMHGKMKVKAEMKKMPGQDQSQMYIYDVFHIPAGI